ncbi:MAG: hypothetical protein EOP47_11020 [Sphingobacteriaceae bacterium]|nr:MAG: hypothetical protein EOP47_11020 [Sphingobacteriaceae bacterium]
MYWCKNIYHTLFAAGIGIILLLPACKPAIKDDGVTAKYFDLKAYFKADAARLSRIKKTTLKTVTHNGATETKEVKIDNWERELSLFSEANINKPAWRDSYKIQTTPTIVIYTAKDDDLKTREIIVNKTADKVKYIVIYNYTKNILYYTKEKLTYWPDSLYKIEKTQQVRLLGLNKYVITGKLN